MDGNRYFSLMVVGDNPEELIKKYDESLKCESFVKYHYKDAGKLRKKAIKMLSDILANLDKINISDMMVDYFKEELKQYKALSDFEYYTLITEGLTYNGDGDAISTENPNAKWSSCNLGKTFCIPLKLKDGTTTNTARAKDVDWESMHMANVDQFEILWKFHTKEEEPATEEDQKRYAMVQMQKNYYDKFPSMEVFVNYNVCYWNYAYLDENGWVDASERVNYKWITEFYDNYVKTLKDDDLVTIYECTAPRMHK